MMPKFLIAIALKVSYEGDEHAKLNDILNDTFVCWVLYLVGYYARVKALCRLAASHRETRNLHGEPPVLDLEAIVTVRSLVFGSGQWRCRSASEPDRLVYCAPSRTYRDLDRNSALANRTPALARSSAR